MRDGLRWERVEYESRIDALADDVPKFVEAVLESIDYEAIRVCESQWKVVRQFFQGCAEAARLQHSGHGNGTTQAAAYLEAVFGDEPRFLSRATTHNARLPGRDEGFAELMDWLSKPAGFKPTRLRSLLTKQDAQNSNTEL